jgi:hypothetical protein
VAYSGEIDLRPKPIIGSVAMSIAWPRRDDAGDRYFAIFFPLGTL